MKGIDPGGFVTVERGVVAKSEHAMMGFTLDGGLVEEKGETTVQDKLDSPGNGRFVGELIRFKPEFGDSLPVTGEVCEKVMGGGGCVGHGK